MTPALMSARPIAPSIRANLIAAQYGRCYRSLGRALGNSDGSSTGSARQIPANTRRAALDAALIATRPQYADARTDRGS